MGFITVHVHIHVLTFSVNNSFLNHYRVVWRGQEFCGLYTRLLPSAASVR